jgi:hypothetical protein
MFRHVDTVVKSKNHAKPPSFTHTATTSQPGREREEKVPKKMVIEFT